MARRRIRFILLPLQVCGCCLNTSVIRCWRDTSGPSLEKSSQSQQNRQKKAFPSDEHMAKTSLKITQLESNQATQRDGPWVKLRRKFRPQALNWQTNPLNAVIATVENVHPILRVHHHAPRLVESAWFKPRTTPTCNPIAIRVKTLDTIIFVFNDQ